MNQGGEPGHDDYGLPRVDIQIPDDARELDRDVQVYHRELRALRRRERSIRWRAPLRHGGMIVPLIAGCLVLAMIAGMVLTMFSANPHFSGLAGQRPQGTGASHTRATRGSASPAASSVAPSARRNASGGPSSLAASQLPGTAISVAGKRVRLRGLTSIALALVPARCRCAGVIERLISQAMSAGITVFLVGRRGSRAELRNLLPAAARKTAFMAIDAENGLHATYRPDGLMVLLVDARGSVRRALKLDPGFRLEPALRSLR